MQKIISLKSGVPYTNKQNEEFSLNLNKKILSDEHNYWLYIIEAEHKDWDKHALGVFVTKQAFPNESQADHLAQTLAFDECKSRLDSLTKDGRPLILPIIHEGWAVM